MNILFWVLQVALAWLCIAGGVFKIFKIDQLRKGVASMRAIPRGVWAFVGSFECLAGLGLILPGATQLLPTLTAYVAVSMAFESVVISALYLFYGDRSPMIWSLAMGLMAACIAYGRLVLMPF